MKIVVVGGGPGGLASTIFAAKRLRGVAGASVTLIDSNSRRTNGVVTESQKIEDSKAIGIWPPGMCTLNELGMLGSLARKGFFLKDSGYKSKSGNWLAKPSPMGRFNPREPMKPSILFVKEKDLMESLRNSIADDVQVLDETKMVECVQDGEKTIVKTGGKFKTEIAADILIGADGKNSSVRHNCFPNPDLLQYCGFHVFRGISDKRTTDYSFQSWGEGVRFATVPLVDGQVWFAAISGSPKFSNCDQVETTTKEELDILRNETLKDWHEPINEIISNTTHSIHEDAWAMRDFTHDISTGNICLIGDAAHCLDPILALGTSVALKDASTLFMELGKSGYTDVQNVKMALSRFSKNRQSQLGKLSHASRLAQVIGENRHEFIRNTVFSAAPEGLKTMIFDTVIDEVVNF